jgi:catalase
MSFEQAEASKFNPFDVTKIWPQRKFPLREVGRMTLNRNATNYFAEVEQLAFAPANLVPGIEPSPDKMLIGRLFSYVGESCYIVPIQLYITILILVQAFLFSFLDTHRHRLGPNYAQLPVNRPLGSVKTYVRDGPMTFLNQGDGPNYFPNSVSGTAAVGNNGAQSVFPLAGDVQRHDSGDEDNFSQVNTFWTKVLDSAARQRLVNNIAGHLNGANPTIQARALKNFGKVNQEFGDMLAEAVKKIGPTKVDTPKRSVEPVANFYPRRKY